MQITITARGLELTPALRRYAERKLQKLKKYLNYITKAHVILSIEKHRQIAEVTLSVRDLTIRGEECSSDLYSSIDLVMGKLERQILRHKEKLVAHPGRSGERVAPASANPIAELAPSADLSAGQAGEEPRVVRVKRFAMKPLSLDEAVMQMDLLGHSFFVFRNAMTEEVNVLYRRRDGNYGLIEPEA